MKIPNCPRCHREGFPNRLILACHMRLFHGLTLVQAKQEIEAKEMDDAQEYHDRNYSEESE